MRCEEAAAWFGVYSDLPAHAPERLAVDAHIAECPDCAKQFRSWQESADWIGRLPQFEAAEQGADVTDRVSRSVMDRIYAEQSWYLPAVRKTYAFTYAFRRKVASLLAGLLAVFGCAFLYTAWSRFSSGGDQTAGTMDSSFSMMGDGTGIQTVVVPVASLSDPIVLRVTPAMPEYWVALSLLGMIMMLLILNWFSRVRA